MCDLPRSFLALCIYHITSHPARQPPPPGSLGDLVRLGSCCQQLSGARSLCSPLPERQPAFSRQQSSLEGGPQDTGFHWRQERVNAYGCAAPCTASGCRGRQLWAVGLLPEPQPKKQGSSFTKLRRKVREECQASSAQGHLQHPANEDGRADCAPELSRRPLGVGCFSIYWM